MSVSYAAGGTAGPAESFGYDGLQRLTSDTLTSASGATLASEGYGYDSNGNVTSQATGGLLAASSQTYGYDEANRLVSATSGGTTTSYGYDGDGNLTRDGAVAGSYNAQDQLTSAPGSAGTAGYSYALNGSLSAVTPASGSAQGYTWDAYGNMASAGGVSYGYDALGRLVARTGSAGTTSVSYLGTGTLLASDGTSLYSYDPSGAMTGEGPAAGGAGYAVMTDQHGDVAAAFAPTSSVSSLEGSSSYGPYGTVTASGSMPGAGYQGDYTDPATGLVYMNARWYDPATGGFVSSDTAGGTPVPSSVDGNPYAYAGGNPLTGTDPTGQFSCGWCSAAVHDADAGLHDIGTGLGDAARDLASEAELVGEADGPGWLGVLDAADPWLDVAFLAGSAIYAIYQHSSGPGSSGLPSYTGAGGSPAPTYTPSYDLYGVNGTAPTGTVGGPGCLGFYDMGFCLPFASGQAGSYGATGSEGPALAGTCTVACAAPPPPPPPQDCYAGPDPTCTVAAPPGALLHTPLITHVVGNITSYGQLCSLGDCVTEHDKPLHGTVTGTTPGSNTANAASTDDSDQNNQQLLQPVRDQGVQTAPAAGGSAGSGGGGKPPTTPGAAEPPPEPNDGGDRGPGHIYRSQVSAESMRRTVQQIGQDAEDAVASRYPGGRRVTFTLSTGVRRLVDWLTPDGVALESKAGYTTDSGRIPEEIAKDQELLQTGAVRAVRWVFSPGKYGDFGLSGPLARALEEAGIEWEIVSGP